LLATRLGAAATEHLARGQYGLLMGQVQGEITGTPLEDVVGKPKELDVELWALAEVLAK
jgi:6-phosphofructokinase 1